MRQAEMTTRTHTWTPWIIEIYLLGEKNYLIYYWTAVELLHFCRTFFVTMNGNWKRRREGVWFFGDKWHVGKRHLTPSSISFNQQSLALFSATFQYHTHWLRLLMSPAIWIRTRLNRLTISLKDIIPKPVFPTRYNLPLNLNEYVLLVGS